jgi:hypothetical protein
MIKWRWLIIKEKKNLIKLLSKIIIFNILLQGILYLVLLFKNKNSKIYVSR